MSRFASVALVPPRSAPRPVLARRHAACATLTALATLAPALLFVGVASPARAEEPALVLSNEHVGLSRAEIEAAQPGAIARAGPSATAAITSPTPTTVPTTIPTAAPTPSDASARGDWSQPAWTSDFVSSESPPPACAVSPTSPSTCAVAGTVGSFDQCMEVSIRGGAGFGEADHVCHALFPGHG